MKLEKLKGLKLDATIDYINCVDNTRALAQSVGFYIMDSITVSAHMDIKKTLIHLSSILEFKKEASIQLLKCSNENTRKEINSCIEYADSQLCMILGIKRTN